MVFEGHALVADRRPFRDRHAIVTLLSADEGLVRGVARNVRGGRKAGGAALQILSLVHFVAQRAANAELATFRQVDLLRTSYPLGANLDAAAAASVVAELILVFCAEGEAAPRRYRLAHAALEALLDDTPPTLVVSYTQVWMLKLCGLFPELNRCSACNADVPDRVRTSIEDGLPLCSHCSEPSRTRRLGRRDIEELSAYLTHAPGDLGTPPRADTSAWVDHLTRACADRPLKALDFLRRHGEGAP